LTAASVYIGGASAIPINPSVNDIGHATDHGKIYATLAIYENLLTSGGAYVTPTGVQTLTNKTLTSPVINGGTANFNSASINGVAISTTGGGGGTTLTIQSNGANSNTASILNFTGGATVTPGTSGSISINIPSPGSASLTIADEGINPITNTNYINFTGAGVTTAGTSGSVTVTIPGGSGGNALTLNTVTLPATASITGTMQFDGNVPYFTTNVSASSRGILPVTLFYSPSAQVIIPNNGGTVNTASAALFGVGLTVIPNTTYEMELVFELGTTGQTSHSTDMYFLGTAGVSSIGYIAMTQSNASTLGNGPGAGGFIWGKQATSGVTLHNSTGNASGLYNPTLIKGSVRFGSSGTFIPTIVYSASPGATSSVALGSYIKMVPYGTSSVQFVGPWA
jgi:hypothetical protein